MKETRDMLDVTRNNFLGPTQNFSGLQLKRKTYGTVIRAEDIRMDFGFRDVIEEIRGNNKVVQAPAHVTIACTAPVRPPTVSAFTVRMSLPKRIDVPFPDYAIDPGPFFWKESG
jgi:hypothetical protein